MTFYENENNKNSHVVLNDESHLIMHWRYHDAKEKFKELMRRYKFMETYISRVINKEYDKVFVLDDDAKEIKEMIDDIKKRQEEVFRFLNLNN